MVALVAKVSVLRLSCEFCSKSVNEFMDVGLSVGMSLSAHVYVAKVLVALPRITVTV